MKRNGSADSVQQNVETSAVHVTPNGPTRAGPRTAAGAAVVAAVPPAVVAAMSFPTVAAVVVTVAVGAFVARRVQDNRRSPSTPASGSPPDEPETTARPAD